MGPGRAPRHRGLGPKRNRPRLVARRHLVGPNLGRLRPRPVGQPCPASPWPRVAAWPLHRTASRREGRGPQEPAHHSLRPTRACATDRSHCATRETIGHPGTRVNPQDKRRHPWRLVRSPASTSLPEPGHARGSSIPIPDQTPEIPKMVRMSSITANTAAMTQAVRHASWTRFLSGMIKYRLSGHSARSLTL